MDPPRVRSRYLAVLCAAFMATSPASAGPDVATLRERVDAVIGPILAEHQLPGMAVAVTVEGRAYFFNYGVASRETNQAVSAATLFELGSVSKTFTATLGTYAQALGKLSLADRPSRHMPELRGRPIDAATLLHLGTYTAGGLPLQFPPEVADEGLMRRYFQQWKPAAKPGTQRLYSNPSIGLFGRLAGVALQSDFTDAVETELLPKLGLRQTYIRVPPRAMADYAWGYNKDNRPVRVNPGVLDAEAYGVKSTAEDMIRYVQLQLDPSSLEAPLRRAIEASQQGYFAVGGMVQGLGWEQHPYPISLKSLLKGHSESILFEPHAARPVTAPLAGPLLFNKTGSTGGFGAYVAFVPQQRIGVVMLANRSYPIADRVRAGLAILRALAAPAK